jgi:predicted DNA-binding transcriptional regulator YafY
LVSHFQSVALHGDYGNDARSVDGGIMAEQEQWGQDPAENTARALAESGLGRELIRAGRAEAAEGRLHLALNGPDRAGHRRALSRALAHFGERFLLPEGISDRLRDQVSRMLDEFNQWG